MATAARDRGIDRKIGQRIRDLRVDQGLSQEAVGRGMGITFQQIQKYEKGINRLAASRIPRLCEVLHCQPNDLFDVAGENKLARRVLTSVLLENQKVKGDHPCD